jgi:hypothetical protein
MQKEEVKELIAETIADATKNSEIQVESEEDKWLDAINKEAQEKAQELGHLLNCIVEPFVFVVEPLKDAAVGYLRKPDAKQSFKILRSMIEGQEAGIELAIKAQLVRIYNDTIVSDPRFMDENGNYLPENSELNFSLFVRVQKIITILSDKFKKK